MKCLQYLFLLFSIFFILFYFFSYSLSSSSLSGAVLEALMEKKASWTPKRLHAGDVPRINDMKNFDRARCT
jgi:hypothetical protein